MRLRFCAFVFDSRLRTITREGNPVDLPPKAFSLLEALIEARPAPVNKTVLYERLWPETFVVMGNLHTLVSEIRTALGDEEHEIIRTVHGFGYAFAAFETPTGTESKYAIVMGKEFVRLQEGQNMIGRDPEGTVVIDSPEVSRQHACLTVGASGVTLEDLGSKNGTFVGEDRIKETCALWDGAQITIGRTRLILRAVGDRKKTITLPM
jgi:DNA-binding winged helix-turn-helix (wHTH) protein